MAEQAYVPVRFLKSLVQQLVDEEGLTPDYCLAGTGITWAQCLVADGATDFATQLRVYEAVTRHSTLPGIGFRSPAARSFADHGVYGALLMMAPDVKTAFAKIASYVDVVGGLVDYQLLPHRREVIIRTVDKARMDPVVHQLVAEENLAVWKYLALPVAGLEHYLQRICLDYPRPRNWRMYSDLFPNCEIRYNHQFVQAELSADAMEVEMPSNNPEAFAEMERECRRLMDRISQPARSTKLLIDDFMLRSDPQEWHASAIASALNVSERSLRRRLSAQQTKLSDILNQHRLRKACALLTAGQSDQQIASVFGYASADSLRRAFQRWSGRSTQAFRADSRKPLEASEPNGYSNRGSK